jgi:membrane protein
MANVIKPNNWLGLKTVGLLLKEASYEWLDDKAMRLGAALAYYSIFSIAPLFIIALAVAGWIFGAEAAQGRIVQEIGTTVGQPVAKAIEAMLKNAHQEQEGGALATIVGILTLLFGATGVFGQLQDALNTVWKVAPRPGRGVRGFIQDRSLSLTMVLGTGFLLLVSLVITAGLSALTSAWTPASLPGGVLWWFWLNSLVSIAVITLLFAMIFKILPDAEVSWKDTWIGALITALLFTLGKYVLGFYLASSSATSAYCAAGSMVLILLWVYYSSLILIFGAEFTRVYARRLGSGVVVASNAVPLTRDALARQGIPRSADVEQAAHAEVSR